MLANKERQRVTIFVLLSLLALIYAAHIARMRWLVREVRTRIHQQTPESILCGCRELIEARPKLVSDWPDARHLPAGAVVLDSGITPFTEAVPKVIRVLRPDKIIICENHVFLSMRSVPPRYEVIGFKAGEAQYGSTQLIDGLWVLEE